MEPREAVQLVHALLEQTPMDGPMRDKAREATGVLRQVIDILESQPPCTCKEGSPVKDKG